MLKVDRDALICDLAETYHVYGLEGLSVNMLATLSFGLRDNSRIKMKLSETRISFQDSLLAMAVDRLSMLVWAKTKDAEKGRNKPQMIMELLTKEEAQEVRSFDDKNEFRKAWKQITKGG